MSCAALWLQLAVSALQVASRTITELQLHAAALELTSCTAAWLQLFLFALQRCKELGALAMVHGENGDAIGASFVPALSL